MLDHVEETSARELCCDAIRTLATDNEELYPRVAKVLKNETYVDDVLSGSFSIEETIKVRDELISVLNSAGFHLMKITANDPNLLSHVPQEALYDSNFLHFHESSSTKTPGVVWNALTDTFSYVVKSIQSHDHMTKRMVLSAVPQLFDPAGWVAPVVIRSNILMQQLWLERIDWDDVLSSDALWLQYCPSDTIEIHGSCDAYQYAMCACVHVRCKTSSPVVFSNLLLAKSKVAPLKPVCLPHLEPNGAFLLARLIKFVISTFDFVISGVTLWTDSSIVLGWLSKPPWTWETYVANRTSRIHDLVPNAIWRHASTHDNPADLGTRGCRPQDLVGNSLWFHNPRWLTNPPESWPERNPLIVTDIGKRKDVQVLHGRLDDTDELDRLSSYSRALKKRFNSEEYEYLERSEPLPRKSALLCLIPFIDDHGVLRVNGRLTDSSLPYNERYPIILPGNSLLCHLYLVHSHQFLGHETMTSDNGTIAT
ncbi:uncharacterized protein LOC142230916 [Haematobia irritans]|uniref:uncharacterized protein LOC142230916 n=1 Tax=Haematobia irritans TaxID=7368 RepID=UPI003F4FC640